MLSAHLSKDAKALIDAGKMSDFEQTYGSRYLVIERRGASAVIVTITGLSTADKSKLAASCASSPNWSAPANRADLISRLWRPAVKALAVSQT
jgi:hypothetical protein